MKKVLKIKLILLASFLPISLSIIGYLLGIYIENNSLAVIYSILGLISGLALDYACAYRKIFAILLYKIPLPLTLGLLTFWISTHFVSIYLAISTSIIGCLVGLWLNKIIIDTYQFYKIKKRILVIIYLFFSISMMGIFFGIPVFNLILGFFAGNYLSIRVTSYNRDNDNKIKRTFIQGSIFTSITLVALSLLISWIAVFDIEYANYILSYLSLPYLNHNQLVLFAIVSSLGLGIIQFIITLYTAKTMLLYWKNKRIKK